MYARAIGGGETMTIVYGPASEPAAALAEAARR
jgi:hypothetical protein